MIDLVSAKKRLAFIVIMPLYACTPTSETSEQKSMQGNVEGRSEGLNQQKKSVTNVVTLEQLARAETKQNKVLKYKYLINKKVFLSDETKLLPGTKVVDENYQAWRVKNELIVAFNKTTELNEGWRKKLQDWNAISYSLDQEYYQIKLQDKQADLYQVYQQLKQHDDVKLVELRLNIVSHNEAETY